MKTFQGQFVKRDRTKMGLMTWEAEITQQGSRVKMWFHARYSTDGGQVIVGFKAESAMVRHIDQKDHY